MADGASSAPAPAPAPVAARGRPTAAPGPIELADEKTVQTLATPDSFGAPLARLSPSPTGHGYGSTPPSTSTARRGAKPCIFFFAAPEDVTRRARHCAASDPSRPEKRHSGLREGQRSARDAETARTTPKQNASPISAATALGTSIWHQHRTHPALPYPPLSSDLTIVNRPPLASSAALGERP
jgi:hypothetical protein